MALLAVVCLLAGKAGADTGHGTDAVLVLDSSGSMKQTDPKALRVSAAKLFVSLLGENDRAAVFSFSDDGYALIGLTPVRTNEDRARLLVAIGKINARGAHTNLHAAVSRARELLRRTSGNGRQRAILLLTDGRMDTGDRARDEKLSKQLREDLAAQLAAEKVTLHTLAFTPDSDVALLRDLALRTQGQYRLAQRDRDLHSLFVGLFEGIKQPDMLPIEDGVFRVDSAISEVTVVVVKQDGAPVTLRDPADRRHTAASHGPTLRWHHNAYYEMVTMTKPAAGRWQLSAKGQQSRAYIVTDMRLETQTAPRLQVGERGDIRVWLARESAVIAKKELLAETRFTADVVLPDGSISSLPLIDDGQSGDRGAGDGIHGRHIEARVPGSYELRLTAKNPTFERRIARPLTVVPPGEKKTDVTLRMEPPVVKPPLAMPTLEIAKPVAPATKPDEQGSAAATEVKPDQPQKNKRPVAAETATAAPAVVAPDEGINVWLVLGLFTAINLVVGGAGYLVYRRLRQRNAQSGLVQFFEPDAGLAGTAAPASAATPEAKP